MKVLRLTDPSYLLKKLKLREETDTGAEGPSTSNDEKLEEDSRVSTCEFHFSLKFLLIFESCNQFSTIFVKENLDKEKSAKGLNFSAKHGL